MDTGLTTIHEDDVARHLATAQSFVTRMVVMEDGDGRSPRRWRSTGPALRFLHRQGRRDAHPRG
ncbi:MAG: hypothetical protein R3D65_13305 [Zhengella sp.]